jgi:anti-sigma B factor antagonist
MNLLLSSRRVGDVVVMKCTGRIIAGEEAQLVQTRMRTLLDEGSDFVFDLAEVTFIDSSGMGALVRLISNARAKGGDIKMCALPDLVRKSFQLTNLLTVFASYETEEQAITAFYRRPRVIKTGSEDGRQRILCVDESIDVLAYLREILRGAGYKPLTSANMHDALILMRAAKVDLLVLGTKFSTGTNQAAFAKVNPSVPLVPLESEFSRQDAAEAGQKIMREIRSLLNSSPRQP